MFGPFTRWCKVLIKLEILLSVVWLFTAILVTLGGIVILIVRQENELALGMLPELVLLVGLVAFAVWVAVDARRVTAALRRQRELPAAAKEPDNVVPVVPSRAPWLG